MTEAELKLIGNAVLYARDLWENMDLEYGDQELIFQDIEDALFQQLEERGFTLEQIQRMCRYDEETLQDDC